MNEAVIHLPGRQLAKYLAYPVVRPVRYLTGFVQLNKQLGGVWMGEFVMDEETGTYLPS